MTVNHQTIYQHVLKALYGEEKSNECRKTPKFSVNDQVQISKKKKHVEKGYTTNWMEEVFIVSEVQDANATYDLKKRS